MSWQLSSIVAFAATVTNSSRHVSIDRINCVAYTVLLKLDQYTLGERCRKCQLTEAIRCPTEAARSFMILFENGERDDSYKKMKHLTHQLLL